MAFYNAQPEDEYRRQATALANPVTQIDDQGWGSTAGLLEAVPRGVVGAFLKTNDALNDLLAPVDRALGLESFNEKMSIDIPEKLEQWAKPDARTQGQPAQLIQSITEGLGLAVGGAAVGGTVGAAAVLGGVLGHATYAEQTEAGVDENTALKTAGVTALANALGVFLPQAVSKTAVANILGAGMYAEVQGAKTIAGALYATGEALAPVAGKASSAVALGAVGNVGLGMAQRGLTGQILYDNGYKDMAEQYRSFDMMSVAADAILGAAFGGLSHVAHRVDPADVDRAMAIKKQQQYNNAGPGIQTNPLAANVHDSVMGRSIEDLALGKAPQVTPQEAEILTRDMIPDPTHAELVDIHRQAVAEEFNAPELFETPVELPEAPKPVSVEPAEAPVAPVPAEGVAQPKFDVNPLARETLNQLAVKHADLDIQLGDGRSIKLSELPSVLEQNMRNAESDSVLHDIAAACFIRNSL